MTIAERRFPQKVFRANDIRGLAQEELTDDFAFALGRTFAKRVRKNGESQVMLCRDARLSSPGLFQYLSAGLESEQIEVFDLGIGPTPLLGFGLAQSETIQSGIMITASHNPANQNGFKMVLSGSIFFGEALKSLYGEMEKPDSIDHSINPKSLDLHGEYIAAIQSDIGSLSGLKVVLDGANGAAGPLALGTLNAMGATVVDQFCEFDGAFPNRSPDTSKAENLLPLIERVLSENADLGIGFDGDGDRMVAVTDTGRLLNADEVIRLFAKSALNHCPGSHIVFDVKCSTDVAKNIQAMGGVAVMHKSGRSFIQAKMLETNAAFAGEYSAHYFFQDRWYGTDDGIYAACRLLQLCRENKQSLEQICGPVSGKVASGEIYLKVPEERKFRIIEQLSRQKDWHIEGSAPNIIEIDGLRLEYSQGWALIRASNTSAALTLRFEAESEQFMSGLTEKIADALKRVSPGTDTDGIHHVD